MTSLAQTRSPLLDRERSRRTRDRACMDLFAKLADPTRDDPETRQSVEAILVMHLDLADGMARRFRGRGVEDEDLRQVARLALLKAIHRYRPSSEGSFVAFAVPTITGEIKRYFRDHGWFIRPVRRLQELRLAVRDQRSDLEQGLGREPSRAELAQALDVSPQQVAEAETAESGYRPVSTDSTAGAVLLQRIQEHGDAGQDVDNICSRIDLRRALADLPVQTKRILRWRFVDDLTQREIATRLGCSQMQVSRLLGRIIAQLRTRLDGGEEALAG